MAWNDLPIGSAALSDKVGAGALLLSGEQGKRDLFIVTDQGDGEDRSVLYFSEDGSSGIVTLSELPKWTWDVTDIATLEVDLTTFGFDDDAAAGMIGKKDGPVYVAFNAGGGMRPNIHWLNLATFKIETLSRSVRFTKWKLIAGETVLFKWPTAKLPTATAARS